MDFHRTTHAVYGLQYHIVLVTKYRKPCINNEIGKRLKVEFYRLIEGRGGTYSFHGSDAGPMCIF